MYSELKRKLSPSPFLRVWWVLCLGMVFPAGAMAVKIPEFSGQAAMARLQYQCDLGPRVPGSEGNRALQDTLLARAGQLGFPARRACFDTLSPLTGQTMAVCNLTITIPGTGDGPALWLGAHFDTRPVSDQDPDPAKRSQPLPGANDGASGVAVLWQLMEDCSGTPPPRDLVLLFFDGEDSGRSGDPEGFCLGSSHMAGRWRSFGSILPDEFPQGLILLDMIGDTDLSIPQERYSLTYAPDWTRKVFQRAAQLGLTALVPEVGGGIYDDHIPFLRRQIPAVDLIDFDYPPWHTTQDIPSACSPHSLAQIGNLLMDLVYRP